jgi:hypothetical protein
MSPLHDDARHVREEVRRTRERSASLRRQARRHSHRSASLHIRAYATLLQRRAASARFQANWGNTPLKAEGKKPSRAAGIVPRRMVDITPLYLMSRFSRRQAQWFRSEPSRDFYLVFDQAIGRTLAAKTQDVIPWVRL